MGWYQSILLGQLIPFICPLFKEDKSTDAQRTLDNLPTIKSYCFVFAELQEDNAIYLMQIKIHIANEEQISEVLVNYHFQYSSLSINYIIM